MPISATDPRYLAETIPHAMRLFIDECQSRFRLPATHVGSKGDLNHSSGYHRSRNWIVNSPDSAYRLDDYSVRSAADRDGDGNWLAAVDLSLPTSTLKVVCQRLKAASDANDPRVAGWREFLGTVDGVNTYGWDFVGRYRKTPDRSHLWHLHLSRQRRYADTPMLGIIDVMLGDTMSTVYEGALGLYAKLLYEDWSPTRQEWVAAGGAASTYDLLGQNGSARNNLRLHLDRQDAVLAALGADLAELKARPAANLSVEDRTAIVEELKAAIVAELGDVLPTADEINAALDAAIESRLNGATIRTAGH